MGALVLAALAILAHTAVALWARNELTQVEGIVATQARSFAEEGRLYYDLKQYPYTVCAYMPVFYTLSAGLYKLGLPVLLGGRLVSFLAVAWVLYMVWRLILVYTEDRNCALTGLALAGMTQLLLGWGTVGQVDVLAVGMALGAFYQFSLFHVRGEETLDRAGLFALAGLLTKQTVIAAPATIFLLLALQSPKRAVRFAAIPGGIGIVIVLGLNALMNGRFLTNTLFANINPFSLHKWGPHLEYLAVAMGPLLLVAAVAAKAAFATKARAAYVYLGAAAAVFLATAGKVGSDSNYQIETAVALVICSCLGLHAMEFFPAYYRGSKAWVTLLVLPLGLYAVQNLRLGFFGLVGRAGREQAFQTQLAELKPYLQGRDRVLSADSNALVQARRRIEVEPLIYRLLVEAGRVDATEVQRDLSAGRFQAVLLYEDLAAKGDPDPEIPTLTPPQLDTIRKRYRLVKHSPGPYLGGLYVYEPAPAEKAE